MGHFSLLQSHFWIEETFFKNFFVLVFFQDEFEQLSNWSFLNGIGLVIEIHLQSAFTEILESF